ncbi:Intramembrane protease 2 [Diplogelasinospora grovesii]|uniref:Intramembrane protease 2 n=1 Tax=Diplogelasinospora grovesii TaxID=303347 RepID=A0AAN6N858_9PEZI|nr:Intramembrane protease 2 [Diplogelasinospora grovesii]
MSSGNSATSVAQELSNAAPNATRQSETLSFVFSMLLNPEFLLIEALVILSALSIIWLGAHGSLRRPPSAAPPDPKSKKGKKDEQFTEGLSASDAILLPILAGTVLIGLYYLMEWLQDPDIVNKVLRVYMSTMSIASMGRLSGDALDVLTSLVFPSMWVDRRGKLFRIDAGRRCQVLVNHAAGTETLAEGKRTPFPGFLSEARLSDRVGSLAWEIRHLLTEEWTVRLAAHGLFFVEFDIKLNSLLGFPISVLAAIAYYTTHWTALSNLLGSAFGYASFSMLSPTSFRIGTLVLAGLFVYDIVMVFYTPFMITVAEKVDAPIKLVFQDTSGVSILGLGDIIIPGILMALALRFDLYQYYKARIRQETVELKKEFPVPSSEETIKIAHVDYRRVKAPYIDSQGQWGTRFWTTKLGKSLPVPAATSATSATTFPKTYFYASIMGYAFGMVLAMTVLLIFRHGQPALLYLVPCVTGSLWFTGWVRGELTDMWNYTEDGSLDTEDVIVEEDGDGQVVAKAPRDSTPNEDALNGDGQTGARWERNPAGYTVFLLSITAPRHNAPKRD